MSLLLRWNRLRHGQDRNSYPLKSLMLAIRHRSRRQERLIHYKSKRSLTKSILSLIRKDHRFSPKWKTPSPGCTKEIVQLCEPLRKNFCSKAQVKLDDSKQTSRQMLFALNLKRIEIQICQPQQQGYRDRTTSYSTQETNQQQLCQIWSQPSIIQAT